MGEALAFPIGGAPQHEAEGRRLRAMLRECDWSRDREFFSEWQALAATAPNPEPFYQPEWFRAFSKAFFPKINPLVLSVHSEGDLLGVAPLMRTGSFFGRVPARTLRSLSGIHSCRYDVVCNQANRDAVVSEMWRVLQDEPSWDVIEFEDVPAVSVVSKLVELAASDGFLVSTWSKRRTPYMTLGGTAGNPFADCPAEFNSLRKRLPSKLRRLTHEHGSVDFEVETRAVEDAFSRFLMLESSGWKGRNRSAIVSDKATIRFYESVIADRKAGDGVRIYSLRVRGRVIAMHLGLATTQSYYTPKVAYDESFATYSPGQLLNQYAIKDLTDNGFSTFDFLGPRVLWKCVWSLRVREHRNYYIFQPSLRGRVLRELTMTGGGMLRKIRHKFRGDPQEIVWGGASIPAIEDVSYEHS